MTTDTARYGQARRAGAVTNGTTSMHTAPAPRLSATKPTRWSFTPFTSAFQLACRTAEPRTAALTATERPEVAAIGGSLGEDRRAVVLVVARGLSPTRDRRSPAPRRQRRRYERRRRRAPRRRGGSHPARGCARFAGSRRRRTIARCWRTATRTARSRPTRHRRASARPGGARPSRGP